MRRLVVGAGARAFALAAVVRHSSTTTADAGTTVELDLKKLRREPKAAAKGPTPGLRAVMFLGAQEYLGLARLLFSAHYQTGATGRPSGKGDEAEMAQLAPALRELRWCEETVTRGLAADIAAAAGNEEATARVAAEGRRQVRRFVFDRVELRKPLSYALGEQLWFGCLLAVRPPLLCPRPETEAWTHWLVTECGLRAAQHPFRVLDLCTGTGCVGVAIAKHAPNARVTAIDILPEAVACANENARRCGVPPERFEARIGDMAKGLPSELDGSFDVIVCNPPYILPEEYDKLPPDVREWESRAALVGTPEREERQHTYFQELCYDGRRLARRAGDREPALRGAPSLVCEVGSQGHLIAELLENSGVWGADVELHTDHHNQPRWITARAR